MDANSGFSYGFYFAYLVNRFGELGFMFNRQASEIEISGGVAERDPSI